jgi:phosphoserine aminotransferase
MEKRIHIFNAGPAALPPEVLKEAQENLYNFHGEGLSLMEMSHRGKTYDRVHHEAMDLMKEVMGLADNQKVLFMQGGATLQFAAIPMNLAKPGQKVQYVDTGAWSDKAIKEAEKLGYAPEVIASSKDDDYVFIPEIDPAEFSSEAAYLHVTSNNTIRGTEYHSFPSTGDLPLIVDMSSDINARELDYTQFDVIYAGAQKNMGPSGVTIVIIREELLERSPKNIPTMTNYNILAGKESLYNTPPTFGIYIISLVLKWIKSNGGLKGVEAINRKKADLLYGTIDASDFYRGTAHKDHRSLMNVTFRLPSEDLEKRFVAEAAENDMIGLKGHRSVGGCRASIYNATSYDDVKVLTDFMKEFEKRNG